MGYDLGMNAAAKKVACYEDLLSIPPHQVGQVVFGVLHAHPRPALIHANTAIALGNELGPPFRRKIGGPGGWILLVEPEVHLQADILVPDLAGWRKERLPKVPVEASLKLSPDWVCEILSPRTASLDRGDKLKVYAREQVGDIWLVDPSAQTLEMLLLDGASYRLAQVFSGNQSARIPPFDAIELELAVLWDLG